MNAARGLAAGIACAAAALAAGCRPGLPPLVECAAMPVKGWESLARGAPFADTLVNRKEIPYDALSGTSRLLLADSNFAYDTLLTYVFAHPGMDSSPGAPCIRQASLMVRLPLDPARERALAAFERFLGERGLPASIVSGLEASRASGAAFAAVGTMGPATISAGRVDSGARGTFFRVEVSAPQPGNPESAR